VANNNYPQITSVTSEALQAQIRSLLPSQEGFGTDLMAQNVIVPVIDLTPAAEGSNVPENLQTALAFGSQNAFSVTGGSSVIVNGTGFWRVFGTASLKSSASTAVSVIFKASDSLTIKNIWALQIQDQNVDLAVVTKFDFVFFAAAGQTLTADADVNCYSVGSVRQIADVNGTLINPSGYNPQ